MTFRSRISLSLATSVASVILFGCPPAPQVGDLSKGAEALRADIANYTNVTPVVQFNTAVP